MARVPDELDLARAQRLQYVATEIARMTQHREAALITRLVMEHRNGTLTEPAMRSAIAAIAELRALLDDLARAARASTTHATDLIRPARSTGQRSGA